MVTPIYFPATVNETMPRFDVLYNALIQHPELQNKFRTSSMSEQNSLTLDLSLKKKKIVGFPFFLPRLILLSARSHTLLLLEFSKKFTGQTQLYH